VTVALPAELEAWVRVRRADVDGLLDAHLPPPADGDPGRLVEAIRYSLLAPGKRLRPLLALAAAETASGRTLSGRAPVAPIDPADPVLLACCSVELVHCYSLIHDDLPAMDDDDFRRGRPSNHKAFGEATAILAGDGLLTLAFGWIAEAGERAGKPGPYLRAAQALARGAGVGGMVRGQARDLGEPPPADIEALERLHLEKTGALFRAAVEIGGAVASAGPGAAAALSRFGEQFGVAFQHADDLDDADHPTHAAAARERLAARVHEAELAAGEILSSQDNNDNILAGLARSLLRR
jgi:geranylgeranyl pyrophosphate synthase